MDYAVKRSRAIPNAAEVRPWLQDFTLGAPHYGAAHVRAQIRATEDAGLTDWVLWNPGSNYTVEALANASGVAPDLPLPRELAGRAKSADDSAGAGIKGRKADSRDGPLGIPVKLDTIHH
jgi:hypothetical protein